MILLSSAGLRAPSCIQRPQQDLDTRVLLKPFPHTPYHVLISLVPLLTLPTCQLERRNSPEGRLVAGMCACVIHMDAGAHISQKESTLPRKTDRSPGMHYTSSHVQAAGCTSRHLRAALPTAERRGCHWHPSCRRLVARRLPSGCRCAACCAAVPSGRSRAQQLSICLQLLPRLCHRLLPLGSGGVGKGRAAPALAAAHQLACVGGQVGGCEGKGEAEQAQRQPKMGCARIRALEQPAQHGRTAAGTASVCFAAPRHRS